MNWLVVTQPKCDNPDNVAEVRVFVVKAETEGGVAPTFHGQQYGQMIRGVVRLSPIRFEGGEK